MVERPWRFARRCLVAAGLFLATSGVFGQAGGSGDDARTVEDALHQMSDMAGVIFVGQVVAVRQVDGEDGSSGVVEVEFLVAQAVRGCSAGSTYVLREWAGLWAGGDQRYRVGQRLLMFLHEPGPGGVTSPVGGMAGVVPIRGVGNAPHAADASTAAQGPVADLRWVGTKLVRSVAYQGMSGPSVGGGLVVAKLAATGTRAVEAEAVDPSAASVPAQQASVDVVLGMINSWQKGQHASR
jgi:hypothetical protein